MFYVNSAESEIFTSEWLSDRIIELLNSDRHADATALANEWEEAGVWRAPE